MKWRHEMGDKKCPPLEQFLPVQQERQQLEKEIEQFIESHFEASTAAFGALSVFKDPGNDTNGHNLSKQAFKTWLQTFAGVPVHDARFNQSFSVPDIASRRNISKPNANEFYEIKPDTNNGRRDCSQKIFAVANFLHDLRLTFVPGEDYQTIPGKEFVFNTVVGAIEIEVTLKWRVAEVGNILYEICIRAKKKEEVREDVTEKNGFLFALLLLALGIILLVIMKGEGGMRTPGLNPVPNFA
jgi:hypothetical protein